MISRNVKAGYLSVSMTTAVQCGNSTVTWSGDTGPYHLLLTPTQFKEHGYNVWIESIPDGVNSYELPIRQPEGIQYMLTVWGSSGIQYAATTDVMTVQPSPSSTTNCFLSDEAILNLYTFSFNLTSNSGSYPPQCSNMSLTWPSSLESNVTSDYVPVNGTLDTTSVSGRKRQDSTYQPTAIDLKIFDERDASSSEHNGNTTHPPTMFGIIPLGNSFSIPITYSKTSKYAKYLPESSLSDNPTTYTSQGVTHLNWTVDMAKGTRFILVAGIGSQEKWASGGSSSMFTVGQGSSGCIGSEQDGGGAPSVTATTGESTSSAQPDPARASNVGLKRTVVACVLSIVGTLIIVGILFMCRRARNRRRAAAANDTSGIGKKNRRSQRNSKILAAEQLDAESETPLDLIASRNGGSANAQSPPRLSPLILGEDTYNSHGQAQSQSTPISPLNPFDDTPSKQPFLPGPSRSTTLDGGTDTWSSLPVSPVRGRGNPMTRQSSQDALLPLTPMDGFAPRIDSTVTNGTGTWQTTQSPINTGTYLSSRSGGPLQLHEGYQHEDDEDVSDLKRDTIAYLGGSPSNQQQQSQRRANTPTTALGSSGPNRRRRQQREEQEMEFRIHRDAGRVQPDEHTNQNITELPPRYDEVNWEEERAREREG
ncbi:uncharacterized protein I206_106336 [Kwoniella pini CBS 10737]|uniref:Uncharacterized protein n=1 Tax=Kwoniella pini CBS 10737 TaxID=1296096 RepID=A0A1B9HU07_9TREE|nr:uncharacterized protein I206_07138 [Kwoniella pini CBS 10737]OCF46751.1 hypothetical protein I206_07138 [Kwoniella pini CBS 10737]